MDANGREFRRRVNGEKREVDDGNSGGALFGDENGRDLFASMWDVRFDGIAEHRGSRGTWAVSRTENFMHPLAHSQRLVTVRSLIHL